MTTFLSITKVPDILSKDLEHESLYTILERDYGYTIDRAVRTLEARIAGTSEAKLLKIAKGDAIQFIETVAYLSDGSPIEYSLAQYRGDRNSFTFELKRQ